MVANDNFILAPRHRRPARWWLREAVTLAALIAFFTVELHALAAMGLLS